MKPAVVVISLIFFSSVACAQLHLPTWKLISDQNISSFDMLTTRSGLIGIDDNGVRILTKYTNGAIDGLISTNGSITSIIIQDATTAYMAVQGDGIYKSTNGWKDFSRLVTIQNPFLLSVYHTSILARFGKTMNVSTDGVAFQPAGGILPTDSVTAADFFSSQTAIAVTGKKLYRTIDGGLNWFLALDSMTFNRTNSIYIDRSHGVIYVGGSQCMKSLDSGKTWQPLSSIFFTLAGPVVGVRDCSGNFYITPDGKTHAAMYRSVDGGKFFQDAGNAIFSSFRLKKGVALDRSSTFFWLDESGLLGVVRDGIDSVVTDSVSDRLVIQADSGISNSLCPNIGATQFGVSLTFDQCTGIILDSLKLISPAPSFSAKFIPGLLSDTSAMHIAFTYHATHAGSDTAHYRLKFHSPITENIEQKFFNVIGLGIPGSPLLSLTSLALDFSVTGLDSIKKLKVTISNPGCDILIIDTIFSTNPAIFILTPKVFPIKIAPGKSLDLEVSFNPHLSGDYLESLVIQTNAGNRNITLRGTGKSIKNADVLSDDKEEISFYPNPANNILTISSSALLPEHISIRDLMGKEVMVLQTGGVKVFVCDLHMLADGFYVLSLGTSHFERIVIRH